MTRLHASLGRGFRAPTFSQLFSPGFGGQFAGNPDLDPETSWSAEIGVNIRPGNGHSFRVTAWETRIDDLIAFSGPDFMAINVDEAGITGIETGWHWNGEPLRTGLTGTWQDAENTATGTDLLRRAEWKGSATLDWLFGNGNWLGVEVVHTGKRPDVGGTELDAYTLINLRAGVELPAGLLLEGRVENLTDTDYQPLDGYNASGRAAFMKPWSTSGYTFTIARLPALRRSDSSFRAASGGTRASRSAKRPSTAAATRAVPIMAVAR